MEAADFICCHDQHINDAEFRQHMMRISEDAYIIEQARVSLPEMVDDCEIVRNITNRLKERGGDFNYLSLRVRGGYGGMLDEAEYHRICDETDELIASIYADNEQLIDIGVDVIEHLYRQDLTEDLPWLTSVARKLREHVFDYAENSLVSTDSQGTVDRNYKEYVEWFNRLA